MIRVVSHQAVDVGIGGFGQLFRTDLVAFASLKLDKNFVLDFHVAESEFRFAHLVGRGKQLNKVFFKFYSCGQKAENYGRAN